MAACTNMLPHTFEGSHMRTGMQLRESESICRSKVANGATGGLLELALVNRSARRVQSIGVDDRR